MDEAARPGRARARRAYERYDWNSLLGDERETCAIAPTLMDGTSYFPSRPEMEANLAAFAERARARRPLRLPMDRRRGCSTGRTGADRFEVETSDGAYTLRHARPGGRRRRAVHPARARDGVRATTTPTSAPAETYAGRRVCIIGKQNSGFELANGLLPWARQLILVSPSHAKLSVDTKSLVGVRARYVQPFEDHVLGGGVSILDAAIDRVERVGRRRARRPPAPDRRRRRPARRPSMTSSPRPGSWRRSATCRTSGVTTFGASRLPVVTPWWESTTLPGVFVAGTLSQAAKGLQRHGLPANSGAVHGARYNARVLARHIAATRFGVEVGAAGDRPRRTPSDRLATELAEGPDIFHQRGYLARLLTVDPAGGFRDEGIQPLAHILDSGGADGVAATLEADGTGAIYPILFTRKGGSIAEHRIDPGPAGAARRERRPPGHRGRARQALSAEPSGPDGRPRSCASRSAAARSVSLALREREPELRPAELRMREERRPGHRGDARVRG